MPVLESADQKYVLGAEIYRAGCRFQTTTKGYNQRVDGWQEAYSQGNAQQKWHQLLPMPRTIGSPVRKH